MMRLYEERLKAIMRAIEKYVVIDSIKLNNSEIIIPIPVSRRKQLEGKKNRIKVIDLRKPIKVRIEFILGDNIERREEVE